MGIPPQWRLDQSPENNSEYFSIINDAEPYNFLNDDHGATIIKWCSENIHMDDWYIDNSYKLFIKSKHLLFFMLSLSDVLNRRPWE